MGGTGGTESNFTVPYGHQIVTINVRSGGGIDNLQFITDKGLVSSNYGGAGGSLSQIVLGGPLLGLYGNTNTGIIINSMGFIYGI